MNAKDIPIPEAWPRLVRTAMLHVASLARWTMITGLSRCDKNGHFCSS